MTRNVILDMDAYKMGHHMMQHPGYEGLESYGEARVGGKHDFISMYGMYYVTMEYLTCPTKEDLKEAIEASIQAFGYNMVNIPIWEKVIELGYLPIRLKGLPEGTSVPIGTPLFILEETEEWFAPVCNGLETLLMRVWYPTTLMTRLVNVTKQIRSMYDEFGTPELAEYAINDFSARSGSCGEQADIAGMTHLMINRGSDNLHGQRLLNQVYGPQDRLRSVWATKHSVALSFGPGEGEYEYIKHQLSSNIDKLKSIVADTYDYENFIKVVMMREDVQELVKAHIGRIVLRPDSGDMFSNIAFTLDFWEQTYGVKLVKGMKVIDANLGIIQGDGMNPTTIVDLYQLLLSNGWSPDNLVVVSGTGIMYDSLSRDTDRFAMKPSINIINGEVINTVKDPKTDPSKRSKGGQLKVDADHVTHSSMDYEDIEVFDNIECIMIDYYVNGMRSEPNFNEIRERLLNS